MQVDDTFCRVKIPIGLILAEPEILSLAIGGTMTGDDFKDRRRLVRNGCSQARALRSGYGSSPPCIWRTFRPVLICCREATVQAKTIRFRSARGVSLSIL